MSAIPREGAWCVPLASAEALAATAHAGEAAVADAGEVTGSVHSWDLSTGVDGPGTRFVMFVAGCPLRCLYCQNPDTWEMRRGTRRTVSEVLARIDRYRGVFAATGGGVTISGGEPLLQPAFTGAVLRGCAERGIHTALDTSGFLGARASDQMLADTSLVLLDIKSSDPVTYQKVTGRELAPTLAFARRLADLGRPVWVRFVLVPGLTDERSNVEGVAEIVAGLGNVERVDVLPYHRLGEAKHAALGIPYPLEGTAGPTAEETATARGAFEERGLVVR